MTDPVCPPDTAFAVAVDAVRAGEEPATAVAGLIGRMTDDELLWLLDGDLTLRTGFRAMTTAYNSVPIVAGQVDRLGIPGIRFTDGPRGVVMGNSTAFPAAIARAATWDTDLERAIGDAIGAEARVLGANLFAGICVNLVYAPGWGRSQESYGEDPVLLGAMGAAMTEGVHPWVMSCVKHFALNSMEEARFSVDVQVAEDVLHEVYLPHFRTIVEAGADCVMSSYNSVNGTWAGENRHLLTEVLRDTWGFSGFVMTDFLFGLRRPIESVAAGQDLEMPLRQQRARVLPAALADGRLARTDVLTAATRILTAQVRLALRARPTPTRDVVASSAHRDLAREAARRGAVLLRNEELGGTAVLPFSTDTLGRLAVVGRLAEVPNLGDTGSSKVRPPSTVSVLAGLRDRLGDRVVHAGDLAAATTAGRDADAAVVVVGLTSADEGEAMAEVDAELLRTLGGITRIPGVAKVLSKALAAGARVQTGGDRHDLHLHAEDVALIRAVAAVNPQTVVVLIAGGAVVMDPWEREVAGILLAWYPGMEGGRAIADLLLGDAEPGGRLPVAIPRRREDLPVVDLERPHRVLRALVGAAQAGPGRHHRGVPVRLRPGLHHLHTCRSMDRTGRERALHRDRVGDQHRSAHRPACRPGLRPPARPGADCAGSDRLPGRARRSTRRDPDRDRGLHHPAPTALDARRLYHRPHGRAGRGSVLVRRPVSDHRRTGDATVTWSDTTSKSSTTDRSRTLTSRVALVTGAGRNVGQGIAVALAAAGYRVAVNDLDDQRTKQTVDLISGSGGSAVSAPFDVTDPDAVAAAVDRVQADLGPIDVVVNNAGIAEGNRTRPLPREHAG